MWNACVCGCLRTLYSTSWMFRSWLGVLVPGFGTGSIAHPCTCSVGVLSALQWPVLRQFDMHWLRSLKLCGTNNSSHEGIALGSWQGEYLLTSYVASRRLLTNLWSISNLPSQIQFINQESFLSEALLTTQLKVYLYLQYNEWKIVGISAGSWC